MFDFKLKALAVLILILILISQAVTQEIAEPVSGSGVIENSVRLPLNLFDTFRFNEKYSPYIRKGLYILGPVFMGIYGFSTWGWNSREEFTVRPMSHAGVHAVDGAADKYGHLWGNFAMKRLATFIFRAAGTPWHAANIEGAILTEIVTLSGEIGDGFGKNYGFDPYDALFNNIGIVIAMILDVSPVLDRMFTMQWEYVPTREMREKFGSDHHDVFTDYSGAKVFFVTKFAGIPYISLTPLRYINFDIGYYARGYNPSKYFSSRTRNIQIGFSINLSIAFGDILPAGYTSSSIQSLFNYYHQPLDWETHTTVLSDRPHEEFE